MGRIRYSRNEVYLDDSSRPVWLHVPQGRDVLLKCVEDASKACQIPPADVVQHADAGTSANGTPLGLVSFSWPTIQHARTEWPDYTSIPIGQVRAHPCTIHYHTPGPHGQRLNKSLRSITATRTYLGISERVFDMIAHRLPGWHSVLPACVAGITIHPPGHKYKTVGPTAASGPYFMLRQNRGSVTARPIKNISRFLSIVEVPDFILKNGQW